MNKDKVLIGLIVGLSSIIGFFDIKQFFLLFIGVGITLIITGVLE